MLENSIAYIQCIMIYDFTYMCTFLCVYVAFRDGVLIGPVVSDFVLKF